MTSNRDVIHISSYDYVKRMDVEHSFFRMTVDEAKYLFRLIHSGCGLLLIDVESNILPELE